MWSISVIGTIIAIDVAMLRCGATVVTGFPAVGRWSVRMRCSCAIQNYLE
jgi:hypothetical protein